MRISKASGLVGDPVVLPLGCRRRFSDLGAVVRPFNNIETDRVQGAGPKLLSEWLEGSQRVFIICDADRIRMSMVRLKS